jgi:hypothetical protein
LLATKRALDEMASEARLPMQTVLANLVEDARRRNIVEHTMRAYQALKADPEAGRTYEAEIGPWETTVSDGLDNC